MARGSFTGSDYLYSDSTPVAAKPVTLAAWVYLTGGGIAQAVLGLGNATSGLMYLSLEIDSTDHVIAWARNQFSSGVAQSASTVSTGNWFHAAAVFAGVVSRTAYLDGQPGSENTNVADPPTVHRIGAGILKCDSVARPLSGYVADFALWNVVLAADEIAALAAGAEPALIRRANLQAAWYGTPGDGSEPDILGTYDLTEAGTVAHQTHPLIRRATVPTPADLGFCGVPV